LNLLISPVKTNIKRKKNKNINIGFKIGNLKNNKTMDNIDNFIKKFKGKIINMHPSLLPKYKGLNTYNRVLENDETYTGCTVHFVNSKLDGGKIILQKKIKILKRDTASCLKKSVEKEEYVLYARAIKKIIN